MVSPGGEPAHPNRHYPCVWPSGGNVAPGVLGGGHAGNTLTTERALTKLKGNKWTLSFLRARREK